MCGILLIVINANDSHELNIFIDQSTKISKSLQKRGPDYYQSIDFNHNRNLKFHIESSILNLRDFSLNNDDVSNEKPFCFNRMDDDSYLQWNGEIYRILIDDQWKNVDVHYLDTKILYDLLSKHDNDVISILSSIHGPWSMTFYDNRNEKLWIGRDPIGRRSLCWNKNLRDKFLIISSVAYLVDKNDYSQWNLIEFEEILTDRIFCFDLKNKSNVGEVWSNVQEFFWPKTLAGFDVILNDERKFISHMPITSQLNMELPSNDLNELLKKTNIFKGIGFEIDSKICKEFHSILSESIRTRCSYHQNKCKVCYKLNSNNCLHSTVAILFSGGLDSVVIARIADNFVEPRTRPIDLLNVAFNSNASDRITGIDAWKELCQICPKRKWNFIQIDIDRDVLESNRIKYIHDLIHPQSTVMDDSIGSAIWFATRGEGVLLSDYGNKFSSYKSNARVVLLGMGSDEQLGGYSRHRKAFKNGDWLSLLNEMRLDIERISYRNLGRDDRITSDHSIEARFPYLDEMLINFLNKIPIWQKCNLHLERGHGEKWLLRKIAHDYLNLRKSSKNLKRAIQFGTKITSYQSKNLHGFDLFNDS